MDRGSNVSPIHFLQLLEPACSGESESKIGRKEIREDKSFREKLFPVETEHRASFKVSTQFIQSSLVFIIRLNPFCHGWGMNVNVNGSNISAFVSTLVLIILNVSWKATLNYTNSLLHTIHFAHLAMDILKKAC